jgi:hypothetical protein
MGENYYSGNDDMSPGAAEIAAGFNAFRYNQMGVADNLSSPPSNEEDVPDADLTAKQLSPGYDRHIIK